MVELLARAEQALNDSRLLSAQCETLLDVTAILRDIHQISLTIYKLEPQARRGPSRDQWLDAWRQARHVRADAYETMRQMIIRPASSSIH